MNQMPLLKVLAFLVVCQSGICRAGQDTPRVSKPEANQRIVRMPGVTIDMQHRCVDVDAKICQTHGLLELIACAPDTKEYESIVVLEARAALVHAGLLMLGAKSGHPAIVRPINKEMTKWISIPPSGDPVAVFLVFKNAAGEMVEHPISDFVKPSDLEAPEKLDQPVSVKPRAKFPDKFVFAGSHLMQGKDGRKIYVAEESGNVISISSFGDEMLCLSGIYSQDNDELMWQVDDKKIPKRGTKVILRLRPQPKPDKPTNPDSTKH